MTFERKTITDYLTITSGVLGRLLISVVYFLIIANSLDLGDFGIFASSSAVGLVLSRVLAFGFISPVYRVAAARHRLLGAYCGGLVALAAASLPLIIFLAAGIHAAGFAGKIALAAFLMIMAAEIIGWRVVEYVVIMLNGLSRFGRAATLVVLGSAVRTLAAIAFFLLPWRELEAWIWFYAAANAVTLVFALLFFAPRMRLRFVWALYPRRMRDALMAAASEITFYIQSELDKLLVLTMAGDRTAGLYAIAMRLIDLTAVPVRSFNQMLVQKIMQEEGTGGTGVMAGYRKRVLIEAVIAVISTCGLLAFVILLWLYPLVLGGNVARVAPYLLPMLAIPALRNLVEYQGELLYARELVVTRALLLAGLAALKLSLMALLLRAVPSFDVWSLLLNGVFALTYCVSALVVYRSLAARAR